MKQNMKRLWLVLCVMSCLLLLSACGQKQAQESAIDPELVSIMEMAGSQQLEAFLPLTEADVELNLARFEKDKNAVMVNALTSWKSVMGDLGAFISIDSTKVEETHEGYLLTADTTFEKRKMEFSMIMSRENELTNISFSPVYTLGENMEKALMNMIMGMGTVFIVLIFISLIIGCFKYINVWEKKQKDKQAKELERSTALAPVSTPAPAPVVPVAPVVPAAPALVAPVLPVATEPLTDDLELVAVITAAISAATSIPAEGLVVRSIKRRSSSWKRA